MSEGLKQFCHQTRIVIEDIKGEMRTAIATAIKICPTLENEAKANFTIAYRHLEDARMRFGKVIQAMEGGVSIWDEVDKKAVEETDNDPSR